MRAPFGLKEICHPILYNKNKIPQKSNEEEEACWPARENDDESVPSPLSLLVPTSLEPLSLFFLYEVLQSSSFWMFMYVSLFSFSFLFLPYDILRTLRMSMLPFAAHSPIISERESQASQASISLLEHEFLFRQKKRIDEGKKKRARSCIMYRSCNITTWHSE